MNDGVRFEIDRERRLAVLTLDRPEAGNAVNTAAMESLAAGLAQAKQDPDVRAVILTGAGNRVFVSGGDLKEFHAELKTEAEVYAKMSQMRRVLETLVRFPKPVIAAVNGAARGGGGEVASACHFRVAAETATIGFIQVKLGISPGWGGGALLARIVGRQQALRMILSGDVLDAQAAERIGLFDRVVPAADVLEAAKEFAGTMTANAPQAVQSLLQLMNEGETLPLAEAMERESRLVAALWGSPQHEQAVEAFLNRKGRKE
ncbi:enoyl-CoA hydratase [Tumebacillus sp. BK434]|uniref:enoyl-CoA hydratase/isomerase family protein n=1 Tax=Tumebacillus sp. BK434 TaxID=2512169 RepID=UPI0010482901|nr:enoyl-CoA hydratase/isomerase family protein [Tumebacillus sp. BK434]TCP53703.1 enoyl-CoA hydratase [Tumebacillus sp. BK434]